MRQWILIGFMWASSTLASASAPAVDISGIWTTAFNSQIGRQEYSYEFEARDRSLTGRASSANGTCEIRNGRINGASVSFLENFVYQGTTIQITYTGTVVANDEIRFTRQVGAFATEELIAQRVR